MAGTAMSLTKRTLASRQSLSFPSPTNVLTSCGFISSWIQKGDESHHFRHGHPPRQFPRSPQTCMPKSYYWNHDVTTVSPTTSSNNIRSMMRTAAANRRVHSLDSSDPVMPQTAGSVPPDNYLQSTQPQPHQQQETKSQIKEQRPPSDPTAKRPTRKCDPYGLQGQSLSFAECMGWMPTLEDGWELIVLDNADLDDGSTVQHDDHSDAATKETTAALPIQMAPTFLKKQYYHPSFHAASQFLSHISFLATNNNHYPYLSMERVLVDDINDIYGHGNNDKIDSTSSSNSSRDDTIAESPNNNSIKTKKRKIKGWIFVSTIQCSSYRPPTTLRDKKNNYRDGEKDKSDNLHNDKGLTYHDFHLAMGIDVEVNREDVKRWLWKEES